MMGPLKKELPDTPFYQEMKWGHLQRTGHLMFGYLEKEVGEPDSYWSIVRTCC